MTIRDYIERYLDDPDVEPFALWAFGPTFKDMLKTDFYNAWNELHGDLLMLRVDSRPKYDIPKMILLWAYK